MFEYETTAIKSARVIQVTIAKEAVDRLITKRAIKVIHQQNKGEVDETYGPGAAVTVNEEGDFTVTFLAINK